MSPTQGQKTGQRKVKPHILTLVQSKIPGMEALMNSKEVEEGVGKGGWKLRIGAPLPKHQGHVVGNLRGASSILGLNW